MPSAAKDYTNNAIDAGKPEAKNASDHAVASGQEAINAVKAATNSVASATRVAAQGAQDWSFQAKEDTKNTANHVYNKSQETANIVINKSQKKAQELGRSTKVRLEDIKQTSANLLDQVLSPELRDRYQDDIRQFAKDRPLASSFIVIQIVALTIPLLVVATISISTFLFALGSALVSSLAVTATTITFFLPVIAGLFLIGTFVWACLATTFFSTNWVYYHLYDKSEFQVEVKHVAGTAERWNREIEENAEKEAWRYIENVENVVKDGKGGLQNGITEGRKMVKNGRRELQNGFRDIRGEAEGR
ncbi:hypothetical protein BP6252_07515 [Coleophoma cylindrospora]|uniref:Uncharacterized protein n=1 Tax=Coleophoma cylindrospora TaxID=1849047 RepID=A0A3D8RA75_9HELO|nr:hypothetical protein BP6252_07515 [Coleophoma cylindrospora]